MFKNSYQNGLLSIFYSCGSNPLAIWDMEVQNGHIKRLTDSEVNSVVLEIVSTNVATTFIKCPRNNQILGIKLPFLVMIVKNLKRYFSFEITILDDKKMRRRFRISNFQSTTKIKPFCTSMPIGLSGGWNQIQFNLADFTRRAYGTQFIETLRVQVHANVRLRRIYFSERLYSEEELPQEYKLYLPLEKKQKKGKIEKKEELSSTKKGPPPPPPVETEAGTPAEIAGEILSEPVKKTDPKLKIKGTRSKKSIAAVKPEVIEVEDAHPESTIAPSTPVEVPEEVVPEAEVTPTENFPTVGELDISSEAITEEDAKDEPNEDVPPEIA